MALCRPQPRRHHRTLVTPSRKLRAGVRRLYGGTPSSKSRNFEEGPVTSLVVEINRLLPLRGSSETSLKVGDDDQRSLTPAPAVPCSAREGWCEVLNLSSIRQNVSKDQRRHNRRIGLDQELGRVDRELFPSNLLIGNRTGVRTIGGRRIADLAEIAPQRCLLALQILAHHRHDANGEVARNTAADLEETNRAICRNFAVIIRQLDHILDTASHRVYIANVAADTMRGKDIAGCRILPARDKDGQILLRRRQHPTPLRVNLIILLQPSAEENAIEKFMWKIAFTLAISRRPLIQDGILNPPNRFFFRDTGIRHPVEMARQQLMFI